LASFQRDEHVPAEDIQLVMCKMKRFCNIYHFYMYTQPNNVEFVLQHCQFEMFSYTKDLSTISTDLSSIFIIDNSPGAYKSYPGK